MPMIGKLVSLVSRRTLRAEGHVFAITPERIALAEGMHAALAMAPMLCAAALLARPEIAFGAVAAFWTCLCDPQGPQTQRLKTMAVFIALGVLVLPLAAYGAHWGYAASVVTLFGLVFLCGLTRSYQPALGPGPAQAGLIASLAVVIGIASPAPLGGALALAGYFLMGSVWTVVFCVYLWPIPFPQSACLTLATIFGRLEDMAERLVALDARADLDASGWAEFDTVYRRAVRMSIERGRALAAHDVRHHPVLGQGIDVAGRVFSALIALGHCRRHGLLPEDEHTQSMLEALRALLHSVTAQVQQMRQVRQVRQVQQGGAALMEQAAALLQCTAGRDDPAARAVAFAALAIGHLGERTQPMAAGSSAPPRLPAVPAVPAVPATPVAPVAPASASPAAGAFRIDTVVWRHALRVAVAAVLAYGVGTWLSVTFAYWAAIAAIVVTQPVSANTWLRIAERACGSLVGGAIAAVLLTSLSGPLAMTLAILPLAVVTVALRLVNYGLFVVFLTPMFMMLSDFIHPAQGLVLARLVNECVGACVGVAVSFLLWPATGHNAVTAAISSAIAANLAFASAALRMEGLAGAALDRLQREAGLASTRLEVARERMLLEGHRHSARMAHLWELVVALRSVCGAAAVIEVLRNGPSVANERQRADRYDALAADMLQALKTGTPAPTLAAAAAPADDLEQAVRHCVAVLDRYLADPPAHRPTLDARAP